MSTLLEFRRVLFRSLNRALVVEKETMQAYGLTEVSVIPVREAGGAMASYAFKHFKNPVVVESIQAHAGIDIGDTMIGMQLREVAVPLRFKQKTIGNEIGRASCRERGEKRGRARRVKEKDKRNRR